MSEEAERLFASPTGAVPDEVDLDGLSGSLEQLSQLVVGQGTLTEALEHIAGFAVTAIPGADGAGLTLFRGARADTIVATSAFVHAVDEIQYAIGEGPCITAASRGQSVRLGSVGQDPDYPQFGPQAAALGVHSMLSLPLFSDGRDGEVLGSINVYAHSRDAFDDRAQELGELFAVPASISVVNAQALSQARLLAERLRASLVAQAAAEREVGARLFRAVEAKHALVSRMSHELRTPLNEVLGFAQLLELDSLSDGQRESVEHILHGGRYLLAMINDVLEITATTPGQVEVVLEAVMVSEVITEAVTEIAPLAEAAGITIAVVDAEVGLHAHADRNKVMLVLHHLLSNAVKYNQVGGSITVSAAVTDVDAGATVEVAISVIDTGRGIAVADIPNLYVPFDRLDVTSQIDGKGLGLALSQQLAALMHGRLDVESQLGRGSTFTVALPISAAPHAPPNRPSR